MKSGAFNTTFLTGADYAKWVEVEEKRHQILMKDAGFLPPRETDRTGYRLQSGIATQTAGLRHRWLGIAWSFDDNRQLEQGRPAPQTGGSRRSRY